MTPSITILDRLTRVAPLGLRFRDVVSGSLVDDGLNVRVYPLGRSSASVAAVANRKGVYVVHHASGLRTIEGGKGDSDYWRTMAQKSFVIEVRDEQRRFQPFHFTEQLPQEGIYKWQNSMPTSPPSSPPFLPQSLPGIPLYSSPVRGVPAGMGVIRAELWDANQDQPAAWAVMEGYLDQQLVVRGIADEEGRIALIFPYPAPRLFPASSPPAAPFGSPPEAATGPALTDQEWPIQLVAKYAAVRPVLSPSDPFATTPELPDLRFTLSQPPATIWSDAALTEPLVEISLPYGRERILKSEPVTTSPPLPVRQSVLFISPAVSPP